MAIPPKYAASHILELGSGDETVVVDLYVDFNCPFSKVIWDKIENPGANALFDRVGEVKGRKLRFVFRNVPQPWHPQSTLLHEASLAVGQLEPSKFWAFVKVLFDHQPEFFDTECANETRDQIYKRIAKLASSVGVDESKFLALLTVGKSKDGKPSNTGNSVTNDLKPFVRFHRQNGVHMTPTVAINGIVDPSFESSTPIDTWIEKLSK